MMGLGHTSNTDGTATRSQPYWIQEWELCSAGEPSCLSLNGVGGAAGKPLVMKRFMDGKEGGGGITGTLSGVSFLGWDSGERGKKPTVVNSSLKLRRGKALVRVLT